MTEQEIRIKFDYWQYTKDTQSLSYINGYVVGQNQQVYPNYFMGNNMMNWPWQMGFLDGEADLYA